jgi:hypothetical protein
MSFELRYNGATTLTQGDTVDLGSVTEGGSAFEYNLQVDNETGSNINPVLGDFTFGNADFSIAGYNATWDGTPNLTDITVRFDPTGLATDDYFSTFVIDATGIGCETDGEYNLVLKATVDAANPNLVVSGNSVAIADGDNTPSLTDHTDYDEVNEGEFFDRTFLLENTGTGNLNITNVTLTQTGTPFSIQTDPTSNPIAEGADFDFTIRLNSSQSLTAGTYTCTVELTTDETGDNTYQWDIEGDIILEVPTLALDTITGATAAYSLRYLTGTYTDDVILVERTSDNTQQGFTPTEITDGTLATWVGAGNDGHVVTWYDQIGSNDFTETAGGLTSTPRIVINGALIQENSLPVMDFDGSNDHLSGGYSIGGLTEFSHWAVLLPDEATNRAWYSQWDDGGPTNDDAALFVTSGTDKAAPHLRVGSSFINGNGATTITNGQYFAIQVFLDDSENNYEFYLDDEVSTDLSIAVSGTITTSNESATVGMTNATDVARVWNGHIFEVVFFDSDKEDQLALIRTYINNYYSIW